MKHLLVNIFICLAVFNCKSQNLVANGSFENYTGIDCVYGGFDNYNSTPIYHILDNWYTLNSSDYFSSLCANPYYGAPLNIFGYSQPKNGNAYVGLIVFSVQSDYKEYIHQHLSSPLIAGKVYCLNFYVSRAERNHYAIHSLGAYFSVNAQTIGTIGYVNKTPQVLNLSGYVTDTAQWTQIQGCYTAIGGEQYITIGNFNSNINTDTLFVGTDNPDPANPTSATYYSYYYIDDVTLIDQATVGVKSLESNNSFDIYPNPNTGLLKFDDLQYSKGDYNVKILDLFGKEIINEVLKEELDISFLDKGVYTLLLYKDKQLVVTKKVIKN
jgi:hypothetical protein